MLVANALWTLQLLVATALLCKTLIILEEKPEEQTIRGFTFSRKSLCKSMEDENTNHQCSQLIGGVVSYKAISSSTEVSYIKQSRNLIPNPNPNSNLSPIPYELLYPNPSLIH